MTKVAIVILNWNGCDMLRRFLPSVLRHSAGQDVAVYVADNGSTDRSVRLLQTDFPTVKLISLLKNYGFAQGYNLALEQVEAEYAVLLNSDVEVSAEWLTPLVAYMDSHPKAAACQPKIRSWHCPEQFEYAGACGGFIDKYGYPFCRGRVMQTVEQDNGQYDEPISVFWATGAALFVRLPAYREVGGLDADFFAHMEEIDLCWRWLSRGYTIACVPQSVVYHVGAATLKRESSLKTYLNFRNNLAMLYKNLPEAELHQVLKVRKWLDALAALSFVLKGQWGNAGAVWRARRDFRQHLEQWQLKRAENLRQTTIEYPPEQAKFSLIYQYYRRGKRRYSELQ